MPLLGFDSVCRIAGVPGKMDLRLRKVTVNDEAGQCVSFADTVRGPA